MICGANNESSFLFLFDSYGINASVDPCGVAAPNVPCNVSETPFVAEYDLGANYSSDFDIADYIFVQNLWELVAQDDVTIRIQASNDSGFATYDEETIVVTTADLAGTLGRDFASPLNFDTARRYWRVSLETDTSKTAIIGAITLGSIFSFRRNPSSNVVLEIEDGPTEGRKNLIKVSMTLKGILNSKKSDFSNQFLAFADVMPVILIDPDDLCLFGYKWIRTRLVSSKTKPSNTRLDYEIKLDFQELP